MNSTCFKVSIENNIAHVVLNRPEKRNSMIPEFWDELPKIIHKIDEESLARVIVISSTGPHFTAGIDTSVEVLVDQLCETVFGVLRKSVADVDLFT